MNEVYERLMAEMLAKWPDMKVEVKKTQISFKNRFMFACASKASGNRLRLTFSLPYRAESERILQATEPYPMRWTHHVVLKSIGDIDDEVMGGLGQAYDFAMNK